MVTSFSSKSELALNLSANYAAGNAGNGSSPQPDGIILGAGAQLIRLSYRHPRAGTAMRPFQPRPTAA